MVQFVSKIHGAALAVLCSSGMAFAAPKNFDVDCDSRDTISGALEKADPGDMIRIRGVCNERVTVRTDRLTLAGRGSAVIQGGMVAQGVELDGLVTIDGARGVVIRNLTIQRSRAEGIFGTRGAAFTVENVILQDNADAGLRAASSTLDITGCTSRRNSAGFDLFDGTQVVFRGNIVANDNRDVGIFLGGTSSFEVRGARIEANNNNSGVVANSNSHIGFWFFNGTQTNGGSIAASGNARQRQHGDLQSRSDDYR
jgi:nitrous oxidase accessory protein NosD